jgi:hypothetical protein
LALGVNVEGGVVDETLYAFNSITVKPGATLTRSRNQQIVNEANGGSAGTNYGQGVTVKALRVTIEATGRISADSQGFSGGGARVISRGYGPGGGEPNSNTSEGGGGYGGAGGDGDSIAVGGQTYGTATIPTALGSGGAAHWATGGAGGGGIKLLVPRMLTVDGTLSADGGNGVYLAPRPAGGGSGGSIYVRAGVINGSGTISAKGGNAGTGGGNGGGGGGGRIHIYGDLVLPLANVSAAGGSARGGGKPGSEGTILCIKPISGSLLTVL